MTSRALVRTATAVTALTATAAAIGLASTAGASPKPTLTGVETHARVAGVSSPNNLSPEWAEHPVATGATPLENPQDWAAYYGYDNNGPLIPASGTNVEASKSEPDKNTYLVKRGLHGADPYYD